MDTLYIGDIPQDYHYALFNTNYIDLYDTPVLKGERNFYRVYLSDNYFYYDFRTTTYSANNNTRATSIQVTDNYLYRRDFPDIALTGFIYIIVLIFLLNIVTSVFKRGGIFSGLL